MRILLIGQAQFGEAVFRALQGAGERIVGVSAPPVDRRGQPDPLWRLAEEAGLPRFETARLKRPEVYEELAALEPDLGVMAFVTHILPERVLDLPRHGTIQYHPSLLPRHRGRTAIAWAIAQGDEKTGVTVFWVDKGIDTGPILLQREVPIGPDDTTASLYFGTLFPLGVEALVEATRLVREGRAPRIPQDEALATYEHPFGDEHARIDWNRPAREVYALVRAANPQPGAYTLVEGRTLRIFDARLGEPAAAPPGLAVDAGEHGLRIALREASLVVQRVAYDGGPKIPAFEFVRQSGLRLPFSLDGVRPS
ncbi:MAG TPA: methionyl-tRNA formyltransferase [Dehalococcoidia bacterium]|nr:methionyl-tRNA formyltransferase [Dehalococcoidia bacterium]